MKKFSIVLFVLVLFSGFGFVALNASVGNEEIGSPAFAKKGFGYTDFIFTSDGREFYTYKNRVLHHWQLMPHIKHLGSLPIGLNIKRATGHNQKSFLFLTPSEKRMIFWTPEHMQLWDLQKKEKLIDKKFKSISSVMTKEGFITVDKNYLITKWDSNTLQILQQNRLENICRYDMVPKEKWFYNCTPRVLLTKDDKLYTISHYLQREIDLSTLKEIKHLEEEFGLNGHMTSDKRYIVDYKTIDLDSFEILSKKQHLDKLSSLEYRRSFIFGLLYISTSVSKKESFFTIGFINKQGNDYEVIGLFLHDDVGNWHFRTKHYIFSTSFPLNKLKMRLTGDKIVPMNKATYDKYHKTINFEELKDGKR